MRAFVCVRAQEKERAKGGTQKITGYLQVSREKHNKATSKLELPINKFDKLRIYLVYLPSMTNTVRKFRLIRKKTGFPKFCSALFISQLKTTRTTIGFSSNKMVIYNFMIKSSGHIYNATACN